MPRRRRRAADVPAARVRDGRVPRAVAHAGAPRASPRAALLAAAAYVPLPRQGRARSRCYYLSGW